MIEIRHKKTREILRTIDEHTLQRVNLSGVNLSSADLTYKDLSGIILIDADLSNADLTYANLTRAILTRANLSDAALTLTNLTHADLIGANLIRADLSGANLTNADLRGVQLIGSYLSGAVLNGADLSGADLSGANLSDAKLSDVNLNSAILSGTNLSDTNLNRVRLNGINLWETTFTNCSTLHQAIGIETIVHRGASALDVRTLRACIQHLPDVFLQGVGYTNREIDYLRDLYAQGIQFYSCFLSHSGIDSDFADRLRKDLLDNEVSCWHHRYDMHGGQFWRPQISEAIKVNDKLVLICTEQAVTNDNVAKEVIEAMHREHEANSRKLFPLLLDDFILSPEAGELADRKMQLQEWSEDWIRYVQKYHIPDFRQWKDHDAYVPRFKELLRDLKNPQKRE